MTRLCNVSFRFLVVTQRQYMKLMFWMKCLLEGHSSPGWTILWNTLLLRAQALLNVIAQDTFLA